MMKRGKLRSERGNKRKSVKKNLLNSFNNMVKKNSRKRVIVSGVIVSVLSFSCVWYFQSKSALASNREIYKSLEITNKAEEVKTVTAYDKLIDGEDINILILGDENYLGDVILKEDITSFIENTYNSKVKLTNLSEDNATIYEQLNKYINIKNREFDLVFLCFENNDEKEISEINFSGIYESILRDLKYNNTSVDIIPIVKHESLISDVYYQSINGLATYYGLDLAKVNEDVVKNNIEGEGIEDFRESYCKNLTNIIENNVNNKKEISTQYKDAYYGVTTLFEPYKVTLKGEKKKGFSVSQNKVKSSSKNDYIRYKVDGNIIGLGYETSKNGGIIEIYVNRILYRRIDTKSDNEDLKYILISSNLSGANEIKVVNNDGGDVTLLGVITSGNNTDSKEVEGLNNILARNTGSYNGQIKDDSLYENAKKETNEENKEKQKVETPIKKSENKNSSSQNASSKVKKNESKNNDIPEVNNESTIENKQGNTENSNDILNNKENKNQQNGGNILENNIYNNNNNLGDGITENNNQNIWGSGNNEINSNENNEINMGGNNSNNNPNNSVNNIDNGGNALNNNNNNSQNSSNAINNIGGGSSNENSNGGGEIGEQTSQNKINNAQNTESVNSVESSTDNILSE